MRIRNLAIALMFASGTALAGFSLAEGTAKASPSQTGTVKLDGKETYMQHLRDARKLISDAKDTFEKDPVDSAGHRKEAMEGIDKAIKAIDDEIDEYKAEKK
jgi:hypothetical protein